MKTNNAVATPEYIGDVMNGRRTLIPLQHQPDPALPLALWVEGAEQPTCLLRITRCEDDGEGWTVQVRPWVYEHTPQLLRAGSPLTGGGKARVMSPKKRKFKNVRAKAPEVTEADAAGYTDRLFQALRDEPEAIDPACLNPAWAAAAERRHEKVRLQSIEAAREARELLTVEERLVKARRAAHANFVLREFHGEMLVLRKLRRLGRVDGVVSQVRRIERLAYREAA